MMQDLAEDEERIAPLPFSFLFPPLPFSSL